MTGADHLGSDGGGADLHLGDLQLRRFRAGEFAQAQRDQIEQHTARCGRCRARLAALDDEQRGFERAIPFERFAGGVERAARTPAPRARPLLRRPWVMPVFGLAAAAAVLLVLRPQAIDRPDGAGHLDDAGHSHGFAFNSRKGGPVGAALRIASADGRVQRPASAGARVHLAPGERLRIGYDSDQPRHLLALSLDDQGVITRLYPESGDSLPVTTTAATSYLPDSVELTGRGLERIFVLIGDAPFGFEAAAATVQAGQAKAGDHIDGAAMTATAARMAAGAAAPRIFTWLLEKP